MTGKPATFELHPNVGVGDLRFGDSEQAIRGRFGPPTATWIRDDMLHYDYDDFVARFRGDPRRLAEVSFTPPTALTWRARPVFRDPTVFPDLLRADGAPQEVVGFVVLRNLGLAMTGFHDEEDKAVTAFLRGGWDELSAEMTPFTLALRHG
jgi:hypothetical protein